MSTRVHTQEFACELCAAKAQKAMRCAECGGRLKVHLRGGMFRVYCVERPMHRDLREAQR